MIMAVAGIVVFVVTKMQALFLDSFFSLLAALSTILAIKFSIISKKKNASYPTGMFFLEPFYGVIKSLLMFALLAVSLFESGIDVYQYLTYGTGNSINYNIVLPYTAIMVAMSFSLSFFNKR